MLPRLAKIGISGVLAAVSFWAYFAIREAQISSAFVHDMGHLRQLGAAIDKCSRDHDGIYAERLDSPVLQPYLTSELLAFIQKSGVTYRRPARDSAESFPVLTLSTSEGDRVWRKDGKTEPKKKAANKITAHNAGWPSQFRFSIHGIWSGVCEFWRWAYA
jgi:hypothetical protein